MPGTVKSELLPDADRSHKCDCQEKVSWKRNLPLDKSHFITETLKSLIYKILNISHDFQIICDEVVKGENTNVIEEVIE